MSGTVKRILIIVLVVILLSAANKILSATSNSAAVDYTAQYLSVGYHSEEKFSKTVVIRNKADLTSYYESRPSYNGTPYIPNETAKYDDNYFEDNILIILPLFAGSGGDRFIVNRVTKTNGGLSIGVHQTQKGITDDAAGWHILIELDKSYDTDSKNILVNIP